MEALETSAQQASPRVHPLSHLLQFFATLAPRTYRAVFTVVHPELINQKYGSLLFVP